MKINFRILLVIAISMIGCSKITTALPDVQEINSNWQFKAKDSFAWRTASIPGNVYTDLLAHNAIPDPFVKTNEDKIQWVTEKDWLYKTSFVVSESALQKDHIELSFEGIDTYAHIYLNEHLIASTTNAFRTYKLDVKKYLKRENMLRIEFSNSHGIELKKEQKNPYKLPEGKRIYTRKAQFQYGWDWAPKLTTSGLWKKVTLNTWDAVRFDDLYVKQKKVSETNAHFEIECTITSATEKNIHLFTVANKQSQTNLIALKKGRHTYTVPFDIKNPQLWWTHNLGKPHLYAFDFKLVDNSIIRDERVINKGIRTLKLVTNKDKKGAAFYFELNGKPVYMKGANYIPQSSFQNTVTNQHYEKLLTDVTDANMNMLRVWGGGIYENDIFYELCDAKGILIWQDFMFACAMYPGDQEFLENIEQEAIDQVTRLRNHASIALWCGNNENSEGWHRWGWQQGRSEKEKQAIWKDYQAVFSNILPKTVANLHEEIDYWESSPKFGRGNPTYEFEGDAHDWWVWHDGAPFEHFQKKIPRFMSEFGFQSFPSYETLKYLNQSDSINLHTAAIQSHQKHSRGFQLIREYMQRDYKIPTNDADYVYISQLVQAKGIAMGIEAHRSAKPYNMGTLFWQLNDCWPAISWSSIDYFGNWKALQYKAKKSFKNLLISPKINNDSLHITLINDGFTGIQEDLILALQDFKGTTIWSTKKQLNVPGNSSAVYTKIPLQDLDKSNLVLVARFHTSKRVFFLDKPKNLNLPKGEISKEITKTATGFKIVLKSAVLQKDVFLFSDKKGHFSDNFFDLLPNTAVTITFNSKTTSLQDVSIKSLNTIYEYNNTP